MYKALLALLILCSICWIIQLLPVISVPLTAQSSNIYLSNFQNYTFGVFGVCDTRNGLCSPPRIGYPPTNSTFYGFVEEGDTGAVVLPSDVRYTISKLLVVHVVAFCLSSLLLMVIFYLFGLESIDRCKFNKTKRRHKSHHDTHQLRNEREEEEEEEEDHDDNNHNSESTSVELKRDKRDLTSYLNIMLILTFFSVLTNLLAFLADILLFIPNLSYLGWIQLLPIVTMALITSMLCFIKRSISSRKFFESYDHQYANDDMKTLRNRVMDQSWNDSSSDDGFYVYTDGFYTRNEGDQATRDRVNSAVSLSSSVRRNSRRTLEETYSVNSQQNSYEMVNLR
ncbi:RIM9 [Candida pseudojiufengensis]|uniref:RIM9 n=1 Tax=Candida pseudojiufengensis TaxID=497109 RepID=UPI0022241082|nr:RIM9 [Candida pseudojiufengensis]KAI5962977.1 RIM9 [Candida pseudojiufengensis]